MDEIKLKILLQVEPDHQIDIEEDFFELGLLSMHGLIDDNFNLTPAGERLVVEMIIPQISEN